MSTSKVTKRSRHQPYDRSSRDQSGVRPYIQPSGSPIVSTTSRRPNVSSSRSPATSGSMRTIRDFYLAHIRKRFPRFEPRNDFDILALGDGRYKGPEKAVYTWLDQELALQITLLGNATRAVEGAKRILSAQGSVTGWKPSPGDAGVFVRPIPASPYSFRLFPGSPEKKEYCLDFVKTATGLPENSPFEFELWSIGTSSIPHACGPVRLRSLESSWGFSQKDISPGAEKFVLREGLTCILKRPGQKAVRFTVPTRLVKAKDTSNVYDVDLPQHVA